MKKIEIGFIGTGWIGKNYSDAFEEMGYTVVRYSKDDSYIKNKKAMLANKDMGLARYLT